MWNAVLCLLSLPAFYAAAISEKNGQPGSGGGYAVAGAVLLSAGVGLHYRRRPPRSHPNNP